MGPITRRQALGRAVFLGGAALAAPWLPRSAWSAHADETAAALAESPLVYISPLRSDGAESRCHAEVWFVTDGDDVLIVTDAKRWRARAIAQGLERARLWVGDHGVWTTADGAYLASPRFDATASVEADPTVHARALAAFGAKYPRDWGSWGPRFRSGLADGSRVLLRYVPVG